MPTTYYQTTTARNNCGLAGREYEAGDAPTGAATLVDSISAGTTNSGLATWGREGGETDWSGTHRVQLDITSAGGSLSFNIQWLHYATPCNLQQSWFQAEADFAGTGLHIATGSPASGAAGATDEYQARLRASNSHMMNPETLQYRVGTVDSFIEAPWGEAPPAPGSVLGYYAELIGG